VAARSVATRSASARSVLRAGVPGTRNAGTVGAAQRNPARGGVEPRRPCRRSSGAQRSGAGRAARLARGLAAQSLLGEPAVSRSGGPCGPPERDFRSASRGRRRQPPRRADPARRLRRGGSRWAQRGPRRADLRRAARARSARLPARVLQERRFVRDTSRTGRRRRGRTLTARRAKPTRLARGGGAQGLAPRATPGGGQQIA
jgi:hypothetical protein